MHEAVQNGAYDVARVRKDFPILDLEVEGKPLIYFDNAASAQKPTAVLDRLNTAYTTEYANVHRGLHHLSNVATEAYEAARGRVAKFLNAPRNEEIVFTRSATEAINLVASTFGRDCIMPGDEIVLSIMEHHANIVPWHFLREHYAPLSNGRRSMMRAIFSSTSLRISSPTARRWSPSHRCLTSSGRWFPSRK